jgi:hypothetical protein
MEINLLHEFEPQTRVFGFNTNHMIAILGATLMLFAFTFVSNDLQLQSLFSVHSGSASTESSIFSPNTSSQLQVLSEHFIDEFVQNELGVPADAVANFDSSTSSSSVINSAPLPGSTVSTGFAPRGPMINPRGNP